MIRAGLHPKARAELNAATRYYRREAGREVADRFLAEFWRCVGWLQENPEAATPAEPEGVRKKVLQAGFPYTLYYLVFPERIRIVMVVHQKQEPRDSSDRLRL